MWRRPYQHTLDMITVSPSAMNCLYRRKFVITASDIQAYLTSTRTRARDESSLPRSHLTAFPL